MCKVFLSPALCSESQQCAIYSHFLQVSNSNSKAFAITNIKACILNPRRDPAFYNLNCYIEFPLLNDKYTILDGDLNPP